MEPKLPGEARAFDAARWVILVHGGAGDIPDAMRATHAAGCARAAEAGAEVLRNGGTALDAVEAAVRVLEDDPHFNAGTGACLNEDGLIELDASIMDGTSARAGAVAALPPFKNPISVARKVLEEGRHVLYAAHGAARFAQAHGFERASLDDMRTERSLQRWKDVKDGKQRDKNWAGGTVGAVARDAHGHVAAATSTGGMIDKGAGRVGDSPILGAGTWADDARGASSTTGDGESFMRTAFSVRLIEGLPNAPAPEAWARSLLEDMNRRVGGTGGVILVDAQGRAAFARITKTMSFGLVRGGDAGEEAASGT